MLVVGTKYECKTWLHNLDLHTYTIYSTTGHLVMRVVRINRNYLQYTEKATEYPVHVGRARGPTALAEPPPFLLLGSGSTFFFFQLYSRDLDGRQNVQ